MLKDKLEDKLRIYNTELNELIDDPGMRNLCFTACGCGNRSTQKKLTSYRNKIGTYGDKIRAIKLALQIVNKEIFMHQDIIDVYNNFLQLRNPELYYDICTEQLTFNSIKEVFNLTMELFLPICKKQVLNCGLVYANKMGGTMTIPLTDTTK